MLWDLCYQWLTGVSFLNTYIHNIDVKMFLYSKSPMHSFGCSLLNLTVDGPPRSMYSCYFLTSSKPKHCNQYFYYYYRKSRGLSTRNRTSIFFSLIPGKSHLRFLQHSFEIPSKIFIKSHQIPSNELSITTSLI